MQRRLFHVTRGSFPEGLRPHEILCVDARCKPCKMLEEGHRGSLRQAQAVLFSASLPSHLKQITIHFLRLVEYGCRIDSVLMLKMHIGKQLLKKSIYLSG